MPRRHAAKATLLGSHQKCWLWGRVVVTETLRAGRWPVREIHLSEDLPPEEIAEVRALAASLPAPVRLAPAERLRQLGHASDHQGYLAKMGPFPYASPESLLKRAVARRSPPALFAVLDGVQDPHNLGAIARSAEALGVEGLFLASRGQVGVTSAVARASAGAVNWLPLCRVDDLGALADRLRRAGVALVGACEKAPGVLADHDFARPTALVLGGEARGIRPDLRRRCDALVRIPQRGKIGSLNVAAAAAICFYEARRARRPVPPAGKRRRTDRKA